MLACALVVFKASAQNNVTRGDTLILANGAKFWIGEQVTLGNGSLPDGNFNSIYFPEVLHITKRSPLNSKYAGQTATIKKFQKDGVYKGTLSYNIIVLQFNELKRYWCDVSPALASNELINPFASRREQHNNNNNNNNKETKHSKKPSGPVVF